MKFRPLHDRVVVRRLEEEQKTKGGIIIPDTAAEKPQTGEVVAVGPGARDEAGKLSPSGVKAGDKVLFGKWSGTEVKIDGEELLIMKESDIMGILEGAKASSEGRLGSPLAFHQFRTIGEIQNGSQRRKIFHRRARADAARRRYSRQCGQESRSGPRAATSILEKIVRRAALDQGRRHRRQGDRARG